MAHQIMKRNQQNPAYCWSVEDLFPSETAWAAAFAACQTLPDQLAAYRGRLGESAQTLLEYLDLSERLNCQVENVYLYAMLRGDEDTANPDSQAMQGRCRSFMVKFYGASAFEGPELAALSEETLNRFYTEAPGLEKYRRYLTRARLGREHILSQPEEDLLAAAGQVVQAPSTIFNAFSDADLRFPPAVDCQGAEHPLTHGSFVSLLSSPDRTVRESAFKNLYNTYRSFSNGLAAMLGAEVNKNVFNARVRRYDSALQSALQPSEIPETVYHNLLEAVHQNLDKLHRYMALRKRVMGLDQLHMYDIYAPMLPEADQVIPFEQARDDVLEADKVMGEEYHNVLSKAFEQRWMDVYENQGKRSGAYSCGCRVHPFVLLNHTDDLKSAFTLAHEMGHAMHSYFSNQSQSPIYSGYDLFVAEVASTCNEALLMQYLLGGTADKRQRAVLINYFLDQFRTTLYRQTQFAEFELKIHTLAERGEALTAKRLCELYYDLNKLYYGPAVEADGEIAYEWARIPHFYRRFYVYQYATGFSAAMALSRRILSGGETAVQDYLGFLRGGCSTDPVSLLRGAGVDVSTPQPVNDALALFGELIDELEGLLR